MNAINFSKFECLPWELVTQIIDRLPIRSAVKLREVAKRFVEFDYSPRAKKLSKEDFLYIHKAFYDREWAALAISKQKNQSLMNLLFTAYVTRSYQLWFFPNLNNVKVFKEKGIQYPLRQFHAFAKANAQSRIFQKIEFGDLKSTQMDEARKFFEFQCEHMYKKWEQLLGVPCFEMLKCESADLEKIFTPHLEKYPISKYWMALSRTPPDQEMSQQNLELVIQAAEKKVGWALFYLGNNKTHRAQRTTLWKEAAIQGCTIAKFYLSTLDEVDKNERMNWLVAAAKDGLQEAKLNASMVLTEGGKEENCIAIRIVKELAMEGNPRAQNILGIAYFKEGSESSLRKAIHWFRVSSKSWRNSQINLITLLMRKKQVVESQREAFNTAIRGRNVYGDPISYYMLGKVYAEINLKDKDPLKAVKCFLQAERLIAENPASGENGLVEKCRRARKEIEISSCVTYFPIFV